MDDKLLDAIVGIKPDPDFMQAIEGMTDQAIKRIQEKFSGASVQFPKPTPQTNPQGNQNAASKATQATNAQADAYKRAKIEAEDLAHQLVLLSKAATQVKDPNLSKGLQLATEDVVRIRTELKNFPDDPLRLESAISSLETVSSRISTLSTGVSRESGLKDASDKEAEIRAEAQALAYSNAKDQAEGLARQLSLLSSASTRLKDPELSVGLKLAIEEVKRIKTELRSLPEDPLNLQAAINDLGTVAGRVSSLGTQVSARSGDEAARVQETLRQSEAYTQAKTEVEGLALQLRLLSKESTRIKDPGLTKDLELAREEVNRVKAALKTFPDDPLHLEAAINDLGTVAGRVNELGTITTQKSVVQAGAAEALERQAELYRATKREAEALSSEVSVLSKATSSLKQPGLASGLELANGEVRRIKEELKTMPEDPLRLQSAIDDLSTVRERISSIGLQISQKSILESDFKRIVEEEQINRKTSQIESRLRRGSAQGLQFDDKIDLNQMDAKIRLTEAEFDRLAKTVNITEKELIDLLLVYKELNDIPVQGLVNPAASQLNNLGQNQIDQTLRASRAAKEAALTENSRSFNTLSNNAYQLGQAFEDAAVGYSLNGFAGAVRGAANNVAFILNDVSRLKEVQDALPAGWAKQLPLIAGIGSALAVTVLPKLIEWISSLFELESKLEDIAEQVAETFEDQSFKVKFEVDAAELRRSLSTAESVNEVLEKIRDLSFNREQKTIEIKSIFEGFDTKRLSDDTNTIIESFENQFREIRRLVDEQDRLTKEIKKDAEEAAADTAIVRNFDENIARGIRKLFGVKELEQVLNDMKGFQQELVIVQAAIRNAMDLGRNGEIPVETAIRVQDQLARFKVFFQEGVKSLGLSKEEAERVSVDMIKVLDVFADKFKTVENLSREVSESLAKSIDIAFSAAIEKTVELQDKLNLTRNVTAGVNVTFDLELFELNERLQEGKKLVEEAIAEIEEKAKQTKVPLTPEFQAGINAIRKNNELVSLQSIEEKILEVSLELEESEERKLRLIEKQGKAKSTDLESYARELQLNALSNDKADDALEKEEENNRRLRENLEKLREAYRRTQDDVQSFQDVAQRVGDIASPLPGFNARTSGFAGFLEEAVQTAFRAQRESEEEGARKILLNVGEFIREAPISKIIIPQALREPPKESFFDRSGERIALEIRSTFERIAERLINSQNGTTTAVKEIDPTPRTQ